MSMLTDMDAARAAYDALPDTVELAVLNKDIGSGVRGNPLACPLAHAANRLFGKRFPPGTVFSANHGSIYIVTRNWSDRFWIGGPGIKLMARFDHGKRVKPGVYQIHKPGRGPGPWTTT